MSQGSDRPVIGAGKVSRRSFLTGTAALVALGATGCASASPQAGGGVGLRFYEQKQEVIAYFDDLLRRFEKAGAV